MKDLPLKSAVKAYLVPRTPLYQSREVPLAVLYSHAVKELKGTSATFLITLTASWASLKISLEFLEEACFSYPYG